MDSEHAPGGIVVYYADGDQEIIHVNRHTVELFECADVDEFLELTGGSFRGFVYEDDRSYTGGLIRQQVDMRGGFDHVYYRIRTKNGRLVDIDDYGRLIEREGERPVFYVFLVEVMQGGGVDWLTGLMGMGSFQDMAQAYATAIAESGDRTVAVAMDLTGMKSFNTQYGRSEGDALLRDFGASLRRAFGFEACSRFAEDHFYALSGERSVQEKLDALFEYYNASDSGRILPVRVGAYECEPDDDIAAIGFDRAKIACDLDRNTWASHVTWFTEDMRVHERVRNHVLGNLDRAIDESWVRPHYQPVVRATTGEICGEEALARWADPEYGALSPIQFIPVLEEAGLLHKLDMHIVDCVLADMREKMESGVPIVPVSVNISLRDLGSVDIADEIMRRVDSAGLSHDLLRVEFTESAASDNPEFFKSQVDALRLEGFQVWMDDFGSGYSSLNMLQEFEFDLIKLDMGFLRGSHFEKSQVIVAGVIQAAEKLGVATLAEGVETEEQALFLESVGCDMLQGFFYAKPKDLDYVIEISKRDDSMVRENLDETEYWNLVCEASLSDAVANTDARGIDGEPIAEFPAGVFEERNGSWNLLRSNQSMRDFLDQVKMLSKEHSSLQVNALEGDLGNEFLDAAHRSAERDSWERVAGRQEYGTGLQFYIKPIATMQDAVAFMVVSLPTMLGTALGSYGDVPVAYAVFRVVLDEAKENVVDAVYVYANEQYCSWGGLDQSEVNGRSFKGVYRNASELWFPYCYRAAVLRETAHDIIYSPEAGHWLSFNIAPSPVEGCCIFAFTLADDVHHEREEMSAGLDTSAHIIEIASTVNAERSYDAAMNRTLEMMSGIIHPNRLYIHEREEGYYRNSFEWCAEGVEPQIETLQKMDPEEFEAWSRLLEEDTVVLIPDIEAFRESDPKMYRELERQGISRMLAVPFYDDGELIGYLGADDYRLEERLDSRRLLEAIAPFIRTRIVNQRLVKRLEGVC